MGFRSDKVLRSKYSGGLWSGTTFSHTLRRSYDPDVERWIRPAMHSTLWTPRRDIILAAPWTAPGLFQLGSLRTFKAASAGEGKNPGVQSCEKCTQTLCGPDVTTEVIAAVKKTKKKFAEWTDARKLGACAALRSMQDNGHGEMMAAVAWDIVELHNQGWIAGYRPFCSVPPCQNTVQVGNQCYYAGSANYVIFGAMCKLCYDFLPLSLALDYSKPMMLAMIYAYKGGIPFKRKASPNYQISKEWASAGYDGWPDVAAPGGDRPNCAAACPLPYAGQEFLVHWHWLDSSAPDRNSMPTDGTF